MAKEFTCEQCGSTISAETDDELVQRAQEHAERHGMKPSREQVLEKSRTT